MFIFQLCEEITREIKVVQKMLESDHGKES